MTYNELQITIHNHFVPYSLKSYYNILWKSCGAISIIHFIISYFYFINIINASSYVLKIFIFAEKPRFKDVGKSCPASAIYLASLINEVEERKSNYVETPMKSLDIYQHGKFKRLDYITFLLWAYSKMG